VSAGSAKQHAVATMSQHWSLARTMAEWATIEHQTGVEPPPLPPPVNLAEAVAAATQETAGISQPGTAAVAMDYARTVPPIQLQGRVRHYRRCLVHRFRRSRCRRCSRTATSPAATLPPCACRMHCVRHTAHGITTAILWWRRGARSSTRRSRA
jgi:hypothetical protein